MNPELLQPTAIITAALIGNTAWSGAKTDDKQLAKLFADVYVQLVKATHMIDEQELKAEASTPPSL